MKPFRQFSFWITEDGWIIDLKSSADYGCRGPYETGVTMYKTNGEVKDHGHEGDGYEGGGYSFRVEGQRDALIELGDKLCLLLKVEGKDRLNIRFDPIAGTVSGSSPETGCLVSSYFTNYSSCHPLTKGDELVGYMVVEEVPLTWIPEKYSAWEAGMKVIYSEEFMKTVQEQAKQMASHYSKLYNLLMEKKDD